MNDLIFKIITFFLITVCIYILIFFYTLLNLEKKHPAHFKSLEQISFHKKYSSKIHHIRDQYALNYFFKKDEINDLLFSTINEIDKKDFTVLIQGDSWIDQITFSKDSNFSSLKMLQKYGSNKKIEFISGGISSFSPSLMSLQLDILQEDFNILPDIVIAYIDQSDIGDENCRYKSMKDYENGILKTVQPESYSNRIWDYTKIYELIRISLSYKSKYLRTFHLLNFELKHGFLRLITKAKTMIKNKFKKEKFVKCNYPTIEKYLINPKKEHITYFYNTIDNYLEKLKEKKHIKKIFLVTFPQKKHFKTNDNETLYKLNVSDVVDNVLINKKNITHINFSKILLNINDLGPQNIWQEDEIHLNSVIHANLFIKKILEELNNFLETSG